MIAFNQDEPGPEYSAVSPRQLKLFALLTVGPIYLLIAVFIVLFGGKEPWVKSLDPFYCFAAASALGMGLGLSSFRARVRLAGGRSRRDAADIRGLMLGLSLTEAPAFLGLMHFVAFRDWTGFLLLLVATLVGFFFHRQDFGFVRPEPGSDEIG